MLSAGNLLWYKISGGASEELADPTTREARRKRLREESEDFEAGVSMSDTGRHAKRPCTVKVTEGRVATAAVTRGAFWSDVAWDQYHETPIPESEKVSWSPGAGIPSMRGRWMNSQYEWAPGRFISPDGVFVDTDRATRAVDKASTLKGCKSDAGANALFKDASKMLNRSVQLVDKSSENPQERAKIIVKPQKKVVQPKAADAADSDPEDPLADVWDLGADEENTTSEEEVQRGRGSRQRKKQNNVHPNTPKATDELSHPHKEREQCASNHTKVTCGHVQPHRERNNTMYIQTH